MTSAAVATETGTAISTVNLWASKNGVHYTGEGRRKTYQWTKNDVARFQARGKPGRPWPKKQETDK